jgi:hypothetical protein
MWSSNRLALQVLPERAGARENTVSGGTSVRAIQPRPGPHARLPPAVPTGRVAPS